MIPGCSSSSSTWSSSWRSSRYLVWAALTPKYECILPSYHFNLSMSPHQTALSPIIYDTLTSLMTSLISIEMEKTVLKCSFSRVRSRARPLGGTAPSASHCITSLAHDDKPEQWFINEFRETCRRGGLLLSRKHPAILSVFSVNLWMNVHTFCNMKSVHWFGLFCPSSEGCSLIKSFGLLWRISPPWPPGPSGTSSLASHKWPPSSTWRG